MFHLHRDSQSSFFEYQPVEMNSFAHACNNHGAFTNHGIILFGCRRTQDRVQNPCTSLEENDYFDLHRSELFMAMPSIYKKSSSSSLLAPPCPPSDADFETPTTTSSRKRMKEADDCWNIGAPTCRQRIMDDAARPSPRHSTSFRRAVKSPSVSSRRRLPVFCRHSAATSLHQQQVSSDENSDSTYDENLLNAPVLALARWNKESNNSELHLTDSIDDLDFKIDLHSFSSSQNDDDQTLPAAKPVTTAPPSSIHVGNNDFLEFDLNLSSLLQPGGSQRPFVFGAQEHDRTLLANPFSKTPFRPIVAMTNAGNASIALNDNSALDDFDFYHLSLDWSSHGALDFAAISELPSPPKKKASPADKTAHNRAVSSPIRRFRNADGRLCKVYSPEKEYESYKNGKKIPVYKCTGCDSGIACNPREMEHVFCTVCEVNTRANKNNFSGYYLHDGELIPENYVE
jgi:hypothetical protein